MSLDSLESVTSAAPTARPHRWCRSAPRAAVVLTALVALLGAWGCCRCGPDPSPAAPYDEGRLASAELAAPAGCRWKRAAVRVTEYRGTGTHPQHTCSHLLFLDDGGGWQWAGALRTFLRSIGTKEFQAMLDARYELEFAADGHALAASMDGTTWMYVGLDGGSKPFRCAHRTFAGRRGDGSIWSNAPTTRDLALDNFADLDDSRHRGAYDELEDAVRYAQEHLADGELSAALADCYLARDNRKLSGDYGWAAKEALGAAVGERAKHDPALKTRVLASLVVAGPDRELRDRAFLALSRYDDAATQDAVASAMPDMPARRCPPEAPLWALGRITSTRRSASPAVFEVLARAAEVGVESNCFGSAWAIRALAALGTPAAWAKVQAAAAVGCDYSRDLPKELPPWRDWQADRVQKFGRSRWREPPGPWEMQPPCWAELALRTR